MSSQPKNEMTSNRTSPPTSHLTPTSSQDITHLENNFIQAFQALRLAATPQDQGPLPNPSQTSLQSSLRPDLLPDSFIPPALTEYTGQLRQSCSPSAKKEFADLCKLGCESLDLEEVKKTLVGIVEDLEKGRSLPALRKLRQVVGNVVGILPEVDVEVEEEGTDEEL